MPRTPQPAPLDGALVINKPRGKTSHDIVESVRRIAGFRQIGHLGTLDPLATGVLVLLLGRATRLMRFYASRRKRYTCAARFGFATDTYDAEGEALEPGVFVAPGQSLRGDGVEIFIVVLFEDLDEEGVFQLVGALEAPVGFGQGADEILFGLVGGGVGLAVAFEMGGERGFLAW